MRRVSSAFRLAGDRLTWPRCAIASYGSKMVDKTQQTADRWSFLFVRYFFFRVPVSSVCLLQQRECLDSRGFFIYFSCYRYNGFTILCFFFFLLFFLAFPFATLCVFNLSIVASFGDAGPASALAIGMLLFLYCIVNRKRIVFDNYAKQYFSCT